MHGGLAWKVHCHWKRGTFEFARGVAGSTVVKGGADMSASPRSRAGTHWVGSKGCRWGCGRACEGVGWQVGWLPVAWWLAGGWLVGWPGRAGLVAG